MTAKGASGQSASKRLLAQDIVVHIFLTLIALIWLVPIVWVFAESFNKNTAPFTRTFFPTELTLDNYVKLFTDRSVMDFPRMFMSTLIIACFTCVISVLFVLAVAYVMSRLRYGLRLVALAIVTEAPYDLATFGSAWDLRSQSPMLGLVGALLVLVLADWVRRRYQSAAVVGALVAAVGLAGVAWMLLLRVGLRQGVMSIGALLVVCALIFWLLEGRENTMMMTAGLVGALSLVTPAVGVAFLHYRNETVGFSGRNLHMILYLVYPLMLLTGWGFTVFP